MNIPKFDLAEFLDRDAAEVSPAQATMDFLCLGTAISEAVGYERDEQGKWVGQETLNAYTHDEEFSLHFEPSDKLGYTLMTEMTRHTDIYSREAYLPLSEHAGRYQTRIATNIGSSMDCVYIPLEPSTQPERLERAYSTAQYLTREVLVGYQVIQIESSVF